MTGRCWRNEEGEDGNRSSGQLIFRLFIQVIMLFIRYLGRLY